MSKRSIDVDFEDRLFAPKFDPPARAIDTGPALVDCDMLHTRRTIIAGVRITRRWPWSKDFGKHVGGWMRYHLNAPHGWRDEPHTNLKYVAEQYARWLARRDGVDLGKTNTRVEVFCQSGIYTERNKCNVDRTTWPMRAKRVEFWLPDSSVVSIDIPNWDRSDLSYRERTLREDDYENPVF